MAKTFHVYVISLEPAIWDEQPKFRKRNPQYRHLRPCVYVGSTAHAPERRLLQHQRGGKTANKFAHQYGRYLLPALGESLGAVTRDAAEQREFEVAERLRELGYAVWQA